MKSSIKLLAALVATLGAIGQSQAVPISTMNFTTVGNTSSILFATTQGGAKLSATAGFELTAISATSATFAVTVANNTLVSQTGDNALMSLGIDVVSPTLTGVSYDSNGWKSGINQNLSTFKNVDLCIWVAQECSGGGLKYGLGEDSTSAVFDLILTTSGNFMTSGISFGSSYGATFQNVGNTGKSFEFAGCIAGTAGCANDGAQDRNCDPEFQARLAQRAHRGLDDKRLPNCGAHLTPSAGPPSGWPLPRM